MKDNTKDDYWYRYVFNENPHKIDETIEEIVLKLNDTEIHVDIFGINSDTNKNIIFIHGTSVYSKFYAEFCYNIYQKGFRVFAPDLVGHGLSGGRRGHFTMEMLTKVIYDLTTYIRENFSEKIGVIGSSLGGITALYCVANDPRLKASICHNAAIFNEDAYKEIIKLKGILKILAPTIPGLSKILPKLRLSVLLYLDFKELTKSDLVRESIDILMKDVLFTKKYSLTSFKTQMRAPLARAIEEIEVPIMFINGEEDNLFSVEYMKRIFERLTCDHKKLVILEKASHLIFQENIQEALDFIIPWLEKII
ncbi:MAG: alpha/beta fold hydrolase [Candidatus Lokiarchaeota archaeon]|nr:alpha/beta fold hydrolase [Candidatus Lokiarchaeota archaeon]MBD3200317.1 alpha/beta fold hydrolase [Candidatus Lokiarchaeota archaeon]